MRWGLLPSWVKEPKAFSLVINARAETVLEKPAFKTAMKRRRGVPEISEAEMERRTRADAEELRRWRES